MKPKNLDSIHHVAVVCKDIKETADWYAGKFLCHIDYIDETWCLISFKNVKLALIKEGAHPPHIGIEIPEWLVGKELKRHQDGTESAYSQDPSGNTVELMKIEKE